MPAYEETFSEGQRICVRGEDFMIIGVKPSDGGRHLLYTNRDIVVASYIKDSIKPIQDALHRNNIPYRNLMNEGTGNENGVNLSSFHNMKGLEFKVVILSDVNNKTFPYLPYGFEEMDEIEKKNHLMNQKALMYVAITRAMQKVLITGSGTRADL